MEFEYSDIDRIAMLIELGLNYCSELKKAVAEDDAERASRFADLYVCVQKLIKDIEKEDVQ